MTTSQRIKLAAALLLVGVSGYVLARSLMRNHARPEQAFFYDLSEHKLFVAPRTAVPPIKGLNDGLEDAVRAVVISTNGDPADKSCWKIAYLEKYSPELKLQMEEAQRTGSPPKIGRAEAVAHRFVKRPEDAEWLPLTSPEAERIVSEWTLQRRGRHDADSLRALTS